MEKGSIFDFNEKVDGIALHDLEVRCLGHDSWAISDNVDDLFVKESSPALF